MIRSFLRSIDRTKFTPDAAEALERAGFSRRDFLWGAGALVVGFSITGAPPKLEGQSVAPYPAIDVTQVDSWLAIGPDGLATAYSGKCDFGQGFRTVQNQLVAEELFLPLSSVNVIICDTARTPDQGVSSGSQGHPTQFGPSALRQALATAREALFQLAAQQLKTTPDQLTAQGGVITLKSDPSQSVTYGQLIGSQQFHLTINPKAVPIKPANYAVLGTSVPRLDVPGKATGQFQYVQQVRVPGMLHGKVVRPPAIGAKVVSVDSSSVTGLPGNVKVVVKNDFVGVVADTEWLALQAAQTLNVSWSSGAPLPDQDTLYAYMRTQPSRDSYSVLAPDVDQNLKAAKTVVSATYVHPFQMHGSIGTSCAVADVQGGSGANATATVWSSTQGIYDMRNSVAVVLGIPNTNVRAIFVEGSGCYGLNGNDAVTYDAALLSQAVGAPVRVQLTRWDEMAATESFGPATMLDLRAGLDSNGQILVWDTEAWTFSKGGRPTAAAPGNIVTGALAGFATPAVVPATATAPTTFSNNANIVSSYGSGCVGSTCGGTGTIKSERVLTHTLQSPFFTGPLRSPSRLQNTFANESFMDEVAVAAKADPVQFRVKHLTDQRLINCVNAAAKQVGWDTRVSPKPGNASTGVVTGRGIACVLYEGNNGYCALVAELSVDQDSGAIQVIRFTASQDSGPVSNPDGLRNQMEGGAMQGMSRALHEELRWDATSGTILSVDWRRFPVYKFGDFLPVIQTVLLNPLDAQQIGAGECVITVAAAAIGNAVFDATGARLRQVPFTPDNVLTALAARPKR